MIYSDSKAQTHRFHDPYLSQQQSMSNSIASAYVNHYFHSVKRSTATRQPRENLNNLTLQRVIAKQTYSLQYFQFYLGVSHMAYGLSLSPPESIHVFLSVQL